MIKWIKSIFRIRTQEYKDIVLLKKLKNQILITRIDENRMAEIGLCITINDMKDDGKISLSQYTRLKYIIHKYKPVDSVFGAFYFAPGLLKPRVKFLNDIINIIKKQSK